MVAGCEERPQEVVFHRPEDESGIGLGGKEGEWRSEASLPALLTYLPLWQAWLAGSQEVPARAVA